MEPTPQLPNLALKSGFSLREYREVLKQPQDRQKDAHVVFVDTEGVELDRTRVLRAGAAIGKSTVLTVLNELSGESLAQLMLARIQKDVDNAPLGEERIDDDYVWKDIAVRERSYVCDKPALKRGDSDYHYNHKPARHGRRKK